MPRNAGGGGGAPGCLVNDVDAAMPALKENRSAGGGGGEDSDLLHIFFRPE